MIWHSLLLLALSFSFSLSDLFQSGSEKELQKLQTTAETALKRHDWAAAAAAYQDLIAHIDPPDRISAKDRLKVDWVTYCDVYHRLVQALLAKKEFALAERFLQQLLTLNLPPLLASKTRLWLARTLAADETRSDRACLAFSLMQQVKRSYAIEAWSDEERSFFHLLQFSLNEHFEILLKKSHCFFLAGHYQESANLLEKIKSAIDKGHYPAASLDLDPLTAQLLTHKVRFEIANNYCHLATRQAKAQTDGIDNPEENLPCLTAELCSAHTEYIQALTCYETLLQKLVPTEAMGSNPHYAEALFEMALLHWQRKDKTKALHYLTLLLPYERHIARRAHLYILKSALATPDRAFCK